MAYKSKFKGKEIDDKLDLIQELSEDISDIKEDIKNITQEEDEEYTSVISDKTLTTPNAVGGIAKGTKLSDL